MNLQPDTYIVLIKSTQSIADLYEFDLIEFLKYSLLKLLDC